MPLLSDINILFLAAGRGQRMGHLTDDLPKPLVPLPQGGCILGRNLETIATRWPDAKVVIVTGYQAEKISDFVRGFSRDIHIRLIENRAFKTTGPLYSLHAGLDTIAAKKNIIANGDTLFDEKAFGQAIAAATQSDIVLLGSTARKIMSDDIILDMDAAGNVRNAGKNLAGPKIVSSGMCVINGLSALDTFKTAVGRCLTQDPAAIWHNVFPALYTDGHPARLALTPEETWHEYDTEEHLTSSF